MTHETSTSTSEEARDPRLDAVIAEIGRWTVYPGDTREERMARAALAAIDQMGGDSL